MSKDEIIAALVQWGCFAADDAVEAARQATRAEQTRVAIDAALRALFANGVIDMPSKAHLSEVGDRGFAVHG